MVMEAIILASQNAFVRNMQILDPVLTTNECLDNRLKTGLPRLINFVTVNKFWFPAPMMSLTYINQG